MGGVRQSAAMRATKAQRSKVARQFAAVAAALVTLIVFGKLLSAVLADKPSPDTKHWFAHVASLLGIGVMSAGIAFAHKQAVRQARLAAADANADPEAVKREYIPGILIGADNRLSTSKLAAFAWTWALAWAVLSLAIAEWVGAPAGWDALVKDGLQDEYLILLGGPFIALVSAKALVSADTASGTQVKVPASDKEQTTTDRLSQAFSDDNGQTDLVDTQYLLFGAITVLVFVVLFIRHSSQGLPDLPDTLVGLASVGATAYVANKVAAKDAPPHLERVVPDRAAPGQEVTLYGRHLLTVSQGGKRAATSDPIHVFVGSVTDVEVNPSDDNAHTSPSGSDYLKLTIPATLPGAPIAAGDVAAPLSVRNADGVVSDNTLAFTLVIP